MIRIISHYINKLCVPMNTGSKSVCSAPVEERGGNNERTNSMIPKCVSKKSVKFPGECNLVTCVIDPVDPWLNSKSVNFINFG